MSPSEYNTNLFQLQAVVGKLDRHVVAKKTIDEFSKDDTFWKVKVINYLRVMLKITASDARALFYEMYVDKVA